MLQLSDKWGSTLVSQPETGIGYQVASIILKDGTRYDQALIEAGCVTRIRGLKTIPFSENQIADVVVTHDKWNFVAEPLEMSEVHRIAQTWVELHRGPKHSQERDANFWAFNRLSDLVRNNPEEAWKVIEAMRPLDVTDEILANIAAGPLEDLLVYHGDKFIDRFEILARDDQQFRKLLGAVWKSRMSDALWVRVKAIAAPPW